MLVQTILLSLLATTATATPVQPTSHADTPVTIVVSDDTAAAAAVPPCAHLIGSYGSVRAPDHVYQADQSCLENGFSSTQLGYTVLESPDRFDSPQDSSLVWIGEAGVQSLLLDQDDDTMSSVFETIQANVVKAQEWYSVASREQGSQRVFSGEQEHVLTNGWAGPGPRVVYQSRYTMIVRISNTMRSFFDSLVPSHLSLVALPDLSTESSTAQEPPKIDGKIVDMLGKLAANVKFSADIDKIVSAFDQDQLVKDVRYLTGESSSLTSRHSMSLDARKAARWIAGKVEASGALCHTEDFLPGFTPNIICRYPSTGNSTDLTILSAHYDSRGSFGRIRAPGGDDDGSGSGHLLGIANIIGKTNVTLQKPLILAFFAGEEQGLFGSHAYATKLRKEHASVLINIQADMLAYHVPFEPMQLGLPESIGTPEASWLVGNLSLLYSPELVVGRTAACCSDHQSFVAAGYPATQVFERNGPIADPQYHQSGDLSSREGYDFAQIAAISRVVFATALTIVGFDLAV